MAATAAVLDDQLATAKDLIEVALRRLRGIAGYYSGGRRHARCECDDRQELSEIPRRV
jgi:hypothetical protein